MKNILITGHLGYLGSELASFLSKNSDINIIGYDNCLYKKIVKDIECRDFREINFSKLGEIDVVIHLAGISSNYDPPEDVYYDMAMRVNYIEAINLAKKAKEAGVKKFIFASSASLYGESSTNYVNEESALNPLTAYAKSKVNAEKELLFMSDDNFSPIILRMVTLFGLSSRMRFDVLVNNLILSSMLSGQIVLKGNGQATRPQVHVRDVCKIYEAIIKKNDSKLNGVIINIGRSDYNLSVLEVAERLGDIMNCEVVLGKEDNSDDRSYHVDFSLQKKLFPEVTFNLGFDVACNEILKFYSNNVNDQNWHDDNIFFNLKRMGCLLERNLISNDFKFLNR